MATTRRQLTPEERARSAAVISLQKAGITDENEQRHICAVWARRPITSRTELTEDEARSLARRVKTMSRAELAAVLARPAPAPELPPGAIVCRPGTLTEHDAAQVRAFAEFLDQAGPPPSREELATVAVCPEDGAATCRASVAECCMTAPTQPVDQVDDHDARHAVYLAGCADCDERADQREVERQETTAPPPPPVPCEPPPENIEEAAEEAARRFHERRAAGIVPAAPNLSEIPPRVPLQLGTPPGRYCMAVCYCGGCTHWAPLPPVDYSKTPGSIDYEAANRWKY